MNQSNILIVLQIKPNFPIPATPSFRSIRDYVTKPPRIKNPHGVPKSIFVIFNGSVTKYLSGRTKYIQQFWPGDN